MKNSRFPPELFLVVIVAVLIACLYSCAALGLGQNGEVLVQAKYVPVGTPVIELGPLPDPIGEDGGELGDRYVIAKLDDLPPNAPTIPLDEDANFSPLESPGIGDLATKLLGPWGALVAYGASLFLGKRPRSHMLAAGKALAKLEPKAAVVSVARATGLAHSSEASKAAAGGATVTSAGMTVN